MVGFCAASAYGWVKGDPSKLLIGWDEDRNGCGWSEGYEDYKYLYWPSNPADDMVEAIKDLDIDKALKLLNHGVCVKECPNSVKSTPVQCKPTKFTQNPENNFSSQVETGEDTWWPGEPFCI